MLLVALYCHLLHTGMLLSYDRPNASPFHVYYSVKELKAEGGSKDATQDDTGREDYMEDTEGELGAANSYDDDDDDLLSSSSDNLVDESIDLLDDEEFPDALEQEELLIHPLASSTYRHELEEPSPSQLPGSFDDGEDINSRPPQLHQPQLQQPQPQVKFLPPLPPLPPQAQAEDRFREPIPSGGRSSPQLKNAKNRKADVVLSRLPMPRSLSGPNISSMPPIPRTMSPTSCSPGKPLVSYDTRTSSSTFTRRPLRNPQEFLEHLSTPHSIQHPRASRVSRVSFESGIGIP